MHCSVAILSQGQLLIIHGLGPCSSDTIVVLVVVVVVVVVRRVVVTASEHSC